MKRERRDRHITLLGKLLERLEESQQLGGFDEWVTDGNYKWINDHRHKLSMGPSDVGLDVEDMRKANDMWNKYATLTNPVTGQ